MANSINTNIAAYYAQANITQAASLASSSVARLSSGNRIVQASDDVASLSIGTSLQTQVSALRTAQVNASQGTSLLQVADGALAQIQNILQQMKSIALQAGSGSLTNTDRGFLDQQFQALATQVDSLTSSTTFNGVKLIDGSLSQTAAVTNVTTAATKAGQTITFNNTIKQGQTVTINGVTLTAGTSNATASSGTTTFAVGANLAASVANIVTVLNNLSSSTSYNNALGKATYSSSGSNLLITSRTGGSLSDAFTVSNGAAVTTTLGDQAVTFTAGSSTATITHPAHGYSAGDTITLTGTSAAAVGNFFGTYQIASVSDANTYTITLKQDAAAYAIASSLESNGNGSANIRVAFANADQYFSVGQSVTFAGSGTVDNIAAGNIDGARTITAVSSTGFTFTAGANANAANTGLGGASLTMFVTNTSDSGGIKVTTSSATSLINSTSAGNTVGSSFNMFGVTTGLTAADQVVATATSGTSTTTTVPFKAGDTITAQVNGVTKTLYTIANSATLTDIVNGINANTGTTGFSASLTYSSGTYNVRVNYSGDAGIILFNGGSNFGADAVEVNTLAGNAVSSTSNLLGATGSVSSIFATGYIDVLSTAAINTGDTTTAVTAATPSATSAPFRNGDTLSVTINGEEKILHTFAATETLNDIVNGINADTASTGVYAAITGSANAYNIRLYVQNASSGTSATDAVVVQAGAGLNGQIGGNTNVTVNKSSRLTADSSLTQVSTANLFGGEDDGLNLGSVSVSGTIGDSVLAALGQSKATVSVLLTQNASANNTLSVAGKTFTFTSNTTAAPDEILISTNSDTNAAIRETLDNAVKTINRYFSDGYALGNVAYQLNQIETTRSGNAIVFTGKGLSNVVQSDGTAASTISTNVTAASVTNSGLLSNASSTFGVDVTGVANAAFTGSISGFSATYKNSASTVDLSVQIGDYTYSATNVNVSVTSATRIRMYSDTVGGQNGGYFDIQLKANQVTAFTDQAGADVVASRLDAAFSSLTFRQQRNISSYSGTGSIVANSAVIGSLVGTKVTAQLNSFDNLKLNDIQVIAPSGSNTDAQITFTIGGVDYKTASGLGGELGANQTYKLISVDDPNQFITFTTGNTGIDLSSDDNAAAVEQALKDAFGAGNGTAALSFQIGVSSSDTLSVSLGSAQTDDIFGGADLDVSTQETASAAGEVLSTAINTLASLRATVGALQTQFSYASAAIQVSVQNQDAARGQLLDTDIAVESTSFATQQVKLQAGISVLAQANQQLQALLKLIG